MRTTVAIDDDVLAAARERARREGTSVGAVLSNLARAGLSARPQPEEMSGDAFLGFAPLPRRGVIVTNEMIDKIREDIGE